MASTNLTIKKSTALTVHFLETLFKHQLTASWSKKYLAYNSN